MEVMGDGDDVMEVIRGMEFILFISVIDCL